MPFLPVSISAEGNAEAARTLNIETGDKDFSDVCRDPMETCSFFAALLAAFIKFSQLLAYLLAILSCITY